MNRSAQGRVASMLSSDGRRSVPRSLTLAERLQELPALAPAVRMDGGRRPGRDEFHSNIMILIQSISDWQPCIGSLARLAAGRVYGASGAILWDGARPIPQEEIA
jgi:hypothetical protein